MSIPVYKLYLMKPKLEAISRPKEAQDQVLQRMSGLFEEHGGKRLVAGEIWSDEHFQYYGVEMFPSWQAMLDYDRCLRDLGWHQHVDSETFVGVELPEIPISLAPLPPSEKPEEVLYKVWISRTLTAGYEDEGSENSVMDQYLEKEKELGVVNMMTVYCGLANEAWDTFGVMRVPSLEVLNQTGLLQWNMRWHQFVKARTYLATATDGILIKP